jgi:hypothetical protein
MYSTASNFSFFLDRKLMRTLDSSKNSKNGAAEALDWDSFYLQNVSAKTAFA